jgi:hypothetical protein
MAKRTAALLAVLVLALPGGSALLTTGCSKPPATSGSGAVKLKDPVWATYGWSRNRMTYIIYFTPHPSTGFNAEGVAAAVKIGEGKEGDVFDGGLDGYVENSKAPFRILARSGEFKIEGKPYRSGNGGVFLIQVGAPSKVQQLQVPLPNSPKDPEEWPTFAEAEVHRILKENPRIKAFPAEPPPDKPDPKKKKP